MSKMTAREKIEKYVEVRPKKGDGFGDVLLYGRRKFNMNRHLSELSDAECEQLIKTAGLGAYIAEQGRRKTGEGNGHKATISPDPKPCECGCGETTRGGSRFRPGHDMRLKSVLRKAAKDGDAKACRELKSRGWD